MIHLRNGLVWLLCFLIALPPEHVWATDKIVVQSGATLTTTPSGKPMLNIAAPNGSGVSHNKFTDFNVTSKGLVINNATALSATNIGGVIEANPNFGGTAASLILNEVTSSNRSYLRGATEIGGKAADYILANPNGITCDGCGFINTPRATLTTGTPTFTGTAMTGLSVNAGDVVIEGLGLDATSATKFDIVTRAATINAQVNATDLGIHTGRQDFDYDARSGTAKAHDGSTKPTFSIDSTALGGMYAGRITLVGTEAGVGVRVAADMAASTGDMILTADGKLELKSDLSAKTDIQLTSTSSDITTDKAVYAGNDLSATANAGTITPGSNGSFGAANNVTIKAANVTSASGGKIVAGMSDTGAMTTSGTLDIQATTQIATGDGFLGAGAVVKLKGPTVDLSRAVDDSSETVRSRGTLRIESGNLVATNGRIASDGAMELAGNSPITIGAGNYNSASTIALTGDSITTAATMTSDQAISLTSTTGDITNTGTIAATTTTTLNSAANITNTGTIESQTGTTVTATGTLDNQSGGKIKSATTTAVNANTVNNAGSIYATTANTVTAQTITNTGSIAAGTNMTFNVASLTNSAGVLFAENNLIVTGYGGAANATLFKNISGKVQTLSGDITINADTFNNTRSSFSTSSSRVWQKTFYPTTVQQNTPFTHPSGKCTATNDSGVCTSWQRYETYVVSPLGTATVTDYSQYPGPVLNAWYDKGTITSNAAAGFITSAGNLTLTGLDFTNDNSTIYADGDIYVSSIGGALANSFNNGGTQAYDNVWYCCHRAAEGRAANVFSEASDSSMAVMQAKGNITIRATEVGNGTKVVQSAPPVNSRFIGDNALAAPSQIPASLDTTSYVNLIPGRDALFVASVAPKPTFLYETQADFINVNNYYGSDYFINKLPEVPGSVAIRLGDAYFDTTLVREAIMRETGQRYLDNTVTDDISQMKKLLDNGLAAQSSLKLAFGISLSTAQINALTSNIVWYVEEEIDGRTVLVPKVYLASATLNAFTNQKSVIDGENVTIVADNITNENGAISANTDLTLTASNDITSNSAELTAGNDMTLTATNGDVNIGVKVDEFRNGSDLVSLRHQRSTVTAGGKFNASAANGNLTVQAADVETGGDATLSAGNDVTIGAVEIKQNSTTSQSTARSSAFIGSTFKSGGKLNITAGGAAKLQGSSVTTTGDATITATGDVAIASTTDTINALGEQDDTLNIGANTASSLTSGGKVSVTSGGTAQVKGSTLTAANDLEVQATGDVVVESSADTFDLKTRTYKKKTITQNR
ncbi:MAG: filamentous hemagglutinin N-terminal domain-containing protein, partial [Magnetovibrio sp.]|nr:filamentous hemagglutinin N-terminal domain-containing protein [Magnetovibrio sp.]